MGYHLFFVFVAVSLACGYCILLVYEEILSHVRHIVKVSYKICFDLSKRVLCMIRK
jgi:hypothetical protein